MIEDLITALSARRLHAEEIGGTINVRHGTGPTAQAANVDPAPFIEWLGARPEAARSRDIAAWANGVLTTMLEPRHSDARQWSFVEAAGSIYPTIEGAGFVHGVRDATGGDPAWVLEMDDDGDIVIGWVLRLGRGLRPLTTGQFDDWGVTRDRVVAAGRSLLFHSTRERRWATTEDARVLELCVGDGHDAARILVAADVFFGEIDDAWRFAIPHPDVLLAVRTPDDAAALAEVAHDRLGRSDYPLDARPWQLAPRGPRPAES